MMKLIKKHWKCIFLKSQHQGDFLKTVTNTLDHTQAHSEQFILEVLEDEDKLL